MPGNQKHPRAETPSKESPKSKKSKGDTTQVEGHGTTTKMATAPVSHGSLSVAKRLPMEGHEDDPPRWFMNFERRIEQRFDNLARSLDDIGHRLVEQEEKLKALEFDSHTARADIEKLKQEKDDLAAKLDDLENRSRRSNLVFFGIPETEGREDCKESMKDLLKNFVGLDPAVLNNIDRCHRTPTFRRGNDEQSKPRIIHMAFSSYGSRDTVRKACIEKFKAEEYKGKKIYVGEDFSRRVLEMRKKKMETFKKIQREGKKPFFSYPDIIRYRVNDKVITVP